MRCHETGSTSACAPTAWHPLFMALRLWISWQSPKTPPPARAGSVRTSTLCRHRRAYRYADACLLSHVQRLPGSTVAAITVPSTMFIHHRAAQNDAYHSPIRHEESVSVCQPAESLDSSAAITAP